MTEFIPLHLGGLAAVKQAARYGGFGMIVIDTIRRAMPGKDFNRGGALFDDILIKLQTLAQQRNIANVVVLHTSKSGAGFDPDPVDDVLGSTVLPAPFTPQVQVHPPFYSLPVSWITIY